MTTISYCHDHHEYFKIFPNKILWFQRCYIYLHSKAKELANNVHLSSNYMVVINGGHQNI